MVGGEAKQRRVATKALLAGTLEPLRRKHQSRLSSCCSLCRQSSAALLSVAAQSPSAAAEVTSG